MIANGFRRIALAQGLWLGDRDASQAAPLEPSASEFGVAETGLRRPTEHQPAAEHREQA